MMPRLPNRQKAQRFCANGNPFKDCPAHHLFYKAILEDDILANYVGVDCPVCKAAFTPQDDVVVCPICGAPHHRSCYQKTGNCAFHEQHAQGYTWVRKSVIDPTEQPGTSGTTIGTGASEADCCPSCGLKNPQDHMFCAGCGTRLGAPESGFHAASQAYTTAFGGVSPNETIAGVSARDLALYVGSSSQYFLPRFREIDRGAAVSINFPAILNFVYFFYRKMYKPAFILLALYLLLQIPSMVYAYEFVGYFAQHINEFMTTMDWNVLMSFTPTRFPWAITLMNLSSYVVFTTSILLMFFSNKIYLQCAVKDIRKIKEKCAVSETFNEGLYTEALARRGNTAFGIAIFVVLALMILSFVVSFLMTLPYLSLIG